MSTLLKRTVGGLLFAAVVVGCLLVPWGLRSSGLSRSSSAFRISMLTYPAP